MSARETNSVTDEQRRKTPTRLWGGRFEGGPSDALARLSVSVQFDWRLAPYDLLGSRAHARVLSRAGLLTDEELQRMLGALDDLEDACRSGEFRPAVADEDVHTALERGLLERLGSLGGKLRAGRSRNDQVATDLRLYLRDHVRQIASRLVELETALIGAGRAEHGRRRTRHDPPAARPAGARSPTSSWPTYRPSPATSTGCATGTSGPPSSPLGSGALAGSSLPLDPEAVAGELGFDSAAANSMDAVSDRDFAVEFLSAAALIGVHLSRLGEEVVCGRRRSSAGSRWTTPTPPARRSCRRRRTPTSPSWRAARRPAHRPPHRAARRPSRACR